jgi:hypothetical protein
MRHIATKFFLVLLVLVVVFAINAWGQMAGIKVEAMSPERLIEMGITGNTTSGLRIVPKGTVVYLSSRDLLGGVVLSQTWTMLNRPIGSTVNLDSTTQKWTTFRPDTTGQYQIKLSITTSTGTRDTTIIITSAKFTGVGSVGGTVPSIAQGHCAGCHAGNFPGVADKTTPWRTSDHATMLQRGLDGQTDHWSGAACARCHSTGYDTQPTASNGNFADLKARLGYQWPTVLQAGNFTAMVTQYPNLAQVATIGCESCHGPGNQHYADVNKTQVSLDAGVCAQCHDEPWRHSIMKQWENAGHSELHYTSTFRQLPSNAEYMTNSFGNCVRCHDARGFVNFTRSVGTPTENLYVYNQQMITCAACHEPHNSSNAYQLRKVTADTLANGYVIPASVGNGGLCLNCHKNRSNGDTYPNVTFLNSRWGPHHSPQGDIYLGKNAYSWGQNIPSSVAHRLVEDACVGCHMSATPDTGNVARDHIGGHSWNMAWTDGQGIEHDNVTKCVECHTGITKFDDIMAAWDYDANGVVESFVKELDGLRGRLARALPPVGVDSISWQMIRTNPDSVNMKRAYYNYLMFVDDASGGIHNPKYAMNILQKSITLLTGVEFDSGPDVPLSYELKQNFPNPFNPSTMIHFTIPKASSARLVVYDILGREVTTLLDQDVAPGVYKVDWNGKDHAGVQVTSGVYFYRLEAGTFSQIKKMVLVK